MTTEAEYGQREYMRKLVHELGHNEERVVAAYAKAERDGIVKRKSNTGDLGPEEYARALFHDGVKKEWF